jgi:beta-aspartyl-peptidase (threonine type)
MIVVTSPNGIVGIKEAMRLLKEGSSAVDAVEAGIRLVEANADDHTVGYGGYPNLLGQVEVDAGIMEGHTLGAGAVAAVQGFQHPISIARQVMDCLPHVLLVGQGAERFAIEMGLDRGELLTDDANRIWEARLRAAMPEEARRQLPDLPDLHRWVEIASDPELAKGTTNFLVQDARGDLCAGVSTSGWAWKYPGRVGDSPLIGAGLYADNRYAAVACTGMGEMAIRAGTARCFVLYLEMGLSLAEAGRRAMTDLSYLGRNKYHQMHVVALDREGRHGGFSTEQDKSYLFMTDQMQEPKEVARISIPIKEDN